MMRLDKNFCKAIAHVAFLVELFVVALIFLKYT